MTKDKSLIQSCVDHINTAVDVDPWAKELVIEMGAEILKQLNNSNESSLTQKTLDVPDINVGDLISRQAVIDALTEYGNGRAVYISVEEAARRIEQLPSVQPDIIACADCKFWICHDRRCGYWNHGVKPLMWCSQAEGRTDEH